MKTFDRHRSCKELRTLCRKAGLTFRDQQYNKGSDYISFEFKHGTIRLWVIYNTFNGVAFGTYGKREADFSTDSTEHEKRPWFKALLAFIYVEKEAAAATH